MFPMSCCCEVVSEPELKKKKRHGEGNKKGSRLSAGEMLRGVK